MQKLHKPLWTAIAILAFFLIGLATAPRLAAAVKATLVEFILPSQPFNDQMTLLGGAKKAIGPDHGKLGVTSLTISNFNNSTQQLFIFAPVITGGNCTSGTVSGGGTPSFTVILEPLKTMQLLFPTPMVFQGIGGHTCIAAEVTTVQSAGSVSVQVNGLLDPPTA